MMLTKNKLMTDELNVEETLFHTANGYLGIRGCFEEGYEEGIPTIRGTYINGFYDIVGLNYPEKLYGFPEEAQRMVNLPDAQTIEIFINGEKFSLFSGKILEYERVLDTEKGITTRKIKWESNKGDIINICFIRMASFVVPELFYSSCEIESEKEISVEFVCPVNCDVTNFTDPNDPRVAAEEQQHIIFDKVDINGDIPVAVCKTARSDFTLGVSQVVIVNGNKAETEKTENGFRAIAAVKGKKFLLEKYVTYSDSRRTDKPVETAISKCGYSLKTGGGSLMAKQEEYLTGFWKQSGMKIKGNKELSDGIEFNLYQLLQSAGRDSISNVSAKGLSGEGYEGHYFWDTEIYIFPFFLFTQPTIAKKLLDFRYSVLDGAREHAKIMGHKTGALYPWRTIAGSECSAYFPSGSAQYHITGDVAHSYMQYWYATGDDDYMEEKGLELLLETARVWLDAGHYDRENRFCIYDITGPDEYTCIVNNNYYTNQVAKHNMLGAAEVYNYLKNDNRHLKAIEKIGFEEEELNEIVKAANAMYLPYDEELGIFAQDDSFLNKPIWDIEATPKDKFPLLLNYHPLYLYRHQVCKQADTVLSHYLYDEGISFEDMKRTYLYYEKITTHDSSLSYCAYSIMASRLGMKDRAYKYYEGTVRMDLDNKQKNTKDGLHTANLGGTWLALAAGYGGLRLRKNGIHFSFSLADEWEGYSFSTVYKSSVIKIDVNKDKAEILLLEGSPFIIYVDGNEYEVKDKVTLEGAVK